NERIKGTAGLRAAEYFGDLRSNQGFVALSRPVSGARACEFGHLEHVQSGAQRKSVRRLEPERRTKTTIFVYSLRAREEPTVSTPVAWNEVENCLKKEKAELSKFRSDQVLARVEKLGDLFGPVEKLKQKLPKKWKA